MSFKTKMGVIYIMRHAEREDRATELQGLDWISTAPRPQDPPLSKRGFEQAQLVGRQLKGKGITKILCSPMLRTCQTAELVATQLGLGANTICVELGLVEEAKHFRGINHEPRPNWNPIVLTPQYHLENTSKRIDLSYVSLNPVKHVRDDSIPNTVREVSCSNTLDRDQITKDRCKLTLHRVLESPQLQDEVVLCVAHYSTVKIMSKTIEMDLPHGEDLRIRGDRRVSCFSGFKPTDPKNPKSPWRSIEGRWGTGDL